MNWPRIPLRDLLVQGFDEVAVDPDQEYPMVGVRGFGRGLYFREVLAGSSTSYCSFYRVHPGDLVMSRVKAWEGAVAVVPNELGGHFVSKEFPCFRSLDERILTTFVWYFLRSSEGMDLLRRATSGMGARRERVREGEFLAVEVPVPSLEEQRRVVDRVDEMFLKVDTARCLRDEADHQYEKLKLALVLQGSHRPVEEFVDWITDLHAVDPAESYQFAGVKSFGRGVFLGDLRTGSDFMYTRLARLRYQDFVFPKLMAWEGAFGMVPRPLDGTWVSPEFQVFRVREDELLPEVLDTYFRSELCLPAVRAASTGTNVRRRRLNPKAFLKLTVPVPSKQAQLVLRELYCKEAPLRAATVAQRRMLAQVEHAVLDRAFRGGL